IVMPCLDEENTIGICISKAKQFIEETGIYGEIIIADNGSADRSVSIAESMGAKVVQVKGLGYGNALHGGISAAEGKYIIMGDSDDSYDFYELAPFVDKLREGFDLVIGNRFLGEIKPKAMPWLHRYLGNPILSGIGKLFFNTKVGDFHCGLRGIRKDSYQKLDLQTSGMEYASEMIVKSVIFNYKISEVPIVLHADGRGREPHLRSWRDGWRHLEFLLIYSPRWLFLYPGIALIAAGSILILWIYTGNSTEASWGGRLQSVIFGMMAVVIGYQSVIFSFFTKVFAESAGLIPADLMIRRLFRQNNLRLMLIAGIFLIISGIIFILLKQSISDKVTPAAALACIIGSQTVLASFFLHILTLKKRNKDNYYFNQKSEDK
ncbi:MAG: hypothetical protein QG635_1892, partial [Bacteroidota bacterium]|nr:hypothetical protein [Bacteroidota bacterium]